LAEKERMRFAIFTRNESYKLSPAAVPCVALTAEYLAFAQNVQQYIKFNRWAALQ
jgi:hypothetical protein